MNVLLHLLNSVKKKFMKKKVLLFIPFLFLTACSQKTHVLYYNADLDPLILSEKKPTELNYSIVKGKVINFSSKDPLNYVIISLKNQEGGNFAVLSNDYGEFKLEKIPFGKYTLSIVDNSGNYTDINSKINIKKHDYQLTIQLQNMIFTLD